MLHTRKFKAGQKVRVIGITGLFAGSKIGEVYTIEEVVGASRKGDYPRDHQEYRLDCVGGWVTEEDIELVE